MRVPRYDEAQVETTALPTPRVPGYNPINEAVGQVGAALGGISREAQEEFLKQKSYADASAVMDATVKHGESALSLQNDWLNKKGHDALNISPALQAYDQSHSNAMQGLQNDTQRRLFIQHTAQERLQFETVLERHAREQFNALNQGNAKAKVDLEQQKMTALYRDPSQYDITNPNSQINRVRAATADYLHMMGLNDSDEQFKAGIQGATGEVYADRIRQLMVDNPGEAQHFFEVHQDDLDPKDREQLKHSVAVASDESAGIKAAEELSPFLGKESYTDLRKRLYEKLQDRPHAFKVAEQQLHSDFEAAKADRIERADGLGAQLETKMAQFEASGKFISPRQLASMPEYQALLKEGGKEGMHVAQSFMRQARMDLKEAEREAKEDRREARAGQALARNEFMLSVSDPSILTSMNESQIRQLGRKAGLKFSDVNNLITQRRGFIKNENELKVAKVDHDMLKDQFFAAGYDYAYKNPAKLTTDEKAQMGHLMDKVKEAISAAQIRKGEKLDDGEKKEIIRQQLLKAHIRSKGWFGSVGEGEVAQFEVKDPRNYVVAGANQKDVDMVVSVLRDRGVSFPTFEQVEAGVKALKGGR